MDPLRWEACREAFAEDGSLRDLHVLDPAPQDVASQRGQDALVAFVAAVRERLGKDVFLGEENREESAWLHDSGSDGRMHPQRGG